MERKALTVIYDLHCKVEIYSQSFMELHGRYPTLIYNGVILGRRANGKADAQLPNVSAGNTSM
jgi:hypothetical protein